MRLTQAHTRTAAIPIDEFDAGRFKRLFKRYYSGEMCSHNAWL